MKLAVIIINRDIERTFTERLVAERFYFTRLASTGGYLKKRSVTLLLGIEDSRVEALVTLLKESAGEQEQLTAPDPTNPLASEAGLPEVQLGAAPI